MGELRRDPFSERLVAVAPERASRPGAWAPAADDAAHCPFCAGHEEQTPPEVLRLGDPWQVRVTPNRFPAFERHEVVVHCPDHRRSLAELDGEHLALVAAAWRERARTAREHGFPYVHAALNEGRRAGASLSHTHSQLVWLRETPPAVAVERGTLAWTAEQVVAAADGLVAFCPYGARSPYETWVAPEAQEQGAFESALLARALELVAELVGRLQRVLGERPALNAWLHDGPHWHIELLPRLTELGGIELGTGIYVNAVPPEAAAALLRDARPAP